MSFYTGQSGYDMSIKYKRRIHAKRTIVDPFISSWVRGGTKEMPISTYIVELHLNMLERNEHSLHVF